MYEKNITYVGVVSLNNPIEANVIIETKIT